LGRIQAAINGSWLGIGRPVLAWDNGAQLAWTECSRGQPNVVDAGRGRVADLALNTRLCVARAVGPRMARRMPRHVMGEDLAWRRPCLSGRSWSDEQAHSDAGRQSRHSTRPHYMLCLFSRFACLFSFFVFWGFAFWALRESCDFAM